MLSILQQKNSITAFMVAKNNLN